jgi:phospholipid/cholesterol/gamma-HCH transport system ATP-binding protein
MAWHHGRDAIRRRFLYSWPMSGNGQPVVEIQVEGLFKAFDGKPVLRGIDLTIRRGSFVAVVGPSGCGKTVLLNLILRLLAPDAGRILVAADERPDARLVDFTALDAQERSRVYSRWGVVFQRNALFSGSVRDNIGLWLKEVRNFADDAVTPIARTALAAVGLPSNDEFLETSVYSLSGGMAKRLAIARALAMDPICMFHDEPTTGLDPLTASQIQDLLLSTHSGQGVGHGRRTTVIITHDKDLLSRLRPRTVMLHKGRVFFDGPFEEFQASRSPIIRPYFELMPILHQRIVDSFVAPA